MTIDPLVTERLILRHPLDAADGTVLRQAGTEALALEFTRIFADPEESRYMHFVPYPYSRKDADGFVNFLEQRADYPGQVELGLYLKSEPERVVGMVSLESIDDSARSAELGYWLRRESWGLGLMSEAASALVAWGFRTLELQRLEAWVSGGNERSLGTLRGLGFRDEGVLRRAAMVKGVLRDRIVLGLLREEWEAKAQA